MPCLARICTVDVLDIRSNRVCGLRRQVDAKLKGYVGLVGP